MGNPLLYNVMTYSTFSQKMVLKCIIACLLGEVFTSRGKSGLCAIPIKSAYIHVYVYYFSNLAKRNIHTSCKQPLQQRISEYSICKKTHKLDCNILLLYKLITDSIIF